MANVFCITYGGRASNGNTYIPYRAIAHTADEAIAIINTWNTYGKPDSQAVNSEWLHIKVNAQTERKIRELFKDGLGTYPSGEQRSYVGLRTTGCGAWDISFYPALADTIEEHERIYNEQRKAAKAERLHQAEIAKQKRIAELNETKRGWYHVELELELSVFATHGNDYITNYTFEGNVIADSGMDAYWKAVKYVKEHPEELTHRGNMAILQFYAQPYSSDYTFQFLGMKTDDGYSVEKWNEWKEKGEI